MITRKRIFLFLFIILVLILALVAWHLLTPKKALKPMSLPPSVVSVISAQKKPLVLSMTAVGTLKSDNAITLTSQNSGLVSQIRFHSGEAVKKGQLLVVLNHDAQRAALQKAKAEYARLSDLSNRYLAVAHTQAVSKTVISQAQFQTRSAKAALMQAQVAYDHCFIRAPFDGELGIRQVSMGQLVSPGQAMVSLQSIPARYVDFRLSENDSSFVHRGAAVSLTFKDGQHQQASVVALSPLIDSSTRTFAVRAQLSKREHTLRPGSFVVVTLKQTLPQNVIEIPQVALNYEPYGASVYVIQKGHAHLQYVQVGNRIGDQAVITRGLKPGQQVVVAGQNKLHEGALVLLGKPH